MVSTTAAAQAPADQTVTLEKNVEQKTAEWEGLAKTLESRIARMLPCDARVRTSIEEVNKASDARIGALSKYLEAAASQAQADALTVSRALSAQQSAARDMDIERAEAEQERIAVEAQLGELTESLKRRAQLAEAHRTLTTIADLIKQRAGGAQQEAERRAAFVAALNDLASAYAARERSIRAEITALATESARWTDYYAARIVRSHTECAITNQTPTRPLQRKKQ